MFIKIAVIEDRDYLREAIADHLREETGFFIETYSNPKEMLFKGGLYHLIISDWDFEGVPLSFFKGQIDPKRLVVFTGSLPAPVIDCLVVLDKTKHGGELGVIVLELVRQIQTRSS